MTIEKKLKKINEDNIGNHIETQESIEKNAEETNSNLSEIIKKIDNIPTSHPKFPKMVEYKEELLEILEKIGNEDVVEAVNSLKNSIEKFKPVKIEKNEIDVSPIVNQLRLVLEKIQPVEIPKFSFNSKGELKVDVNKVGSGGPRAVNLYNFEDGVINPATEEKQDDLIAQIGEVQTTPTTNTLLGRLKAIWDRLADGTQKTQTVGPTGNIASITEEGQLATTIFDSDGNRIQIDGLGNMKTAENSLIVGESFEGNILDGNFWDGTDVLNDGTVTQNGELLLDTGTTSGGSATATSVRKARKIPGTVNQFRSVGHFESAAQANNVRTIGVSDYNASENGAWFKLDGTTFKVVTAKGGVETEVSSGSFNGDVTSWTVDTDIHRFVIEYTSYVCKFFIDGVLIHKVFSHAEFWTDSLTYGIKATNVNSVGNTTDNSLHFQLLCIIRLGQLRTAKAKDFQSGTTATAKVLKYGAGSVTGIVISNVAQADEVTLYDDLTGTAGNELFATGTLGSQTLPLTIDLFGIDFFDGLTLVVDGTCNVTTIYE